MCVYEIPEGNAKSGWNGECRPYGTRHADDLIGCPEMFQTLLISCIKLCQLQELARSSGQRIMTSCKAQQFRQKLVYSPPDDLIGRQTTNAIPGKSIIMYVCMYIFRPGGHQPRKVPYWG
jgi:hypothetical protein